MTVGGKLAARLVPISLLAVIVMTVLARVAIERVLIDEARVGLRSLAVSFVEAPRTIDLVAKGAERQLLPRLQDLVRGPGAAYAAVLDRDGRVLAHTDVAQRGRVVDWHRRASWREVSTRAARFVEVVEPVRAQAEDLYGIIEAAEPVAPLGYVIVGASLEDALADAGRIQGGIFVVILLSMLATLGVSLAFVRRAIRPVGVLAEAAKRVGGGDFAVQVPVVSDDEIGELARRFNAMSRRLADVTVSKLFLNSILDGMLEGLIVTEGDGRIRLLNPRALEQLGGSERDWVGRPIETALPAARSLLTEGAAPGAREGVVRTLGGRELAVLYGVAPLGGPEKGYAVTFADISKRKAAEEELELKAKELERSNRELEQFAYVASHDLQEPLRKVANFTELLTRRYRGQLDRDGEQFAQYIVDGVHRMRAMIQDLLAFSRAGKTQGRVDDLDMNALVRTAAANVEQSLADSDARLEIEPLPRARGDGERLAQVFQNLLGNAIKFRHRDRRLEIRVGGREERARWVFWVDDNGIGVEPQYREKVFVIFQRLHSRKDYPGTGIGLAICRRVVEMHGGNIWIETPPSGVGARVVFTLSKGRGRKGERSNDAKVQSADGRG